MEGCIELVSINGRPLSLIEDSGFRRIIDPILAGLKSDLAISCDSVRRNVKLRALEVRNSITKELNGKFLSLKVDAASRLNRSLLGINVQYIKDGTIILRTLAVKDLLVRHTAENLKLSILETLRDYAIDLKQIVCVTTDNAANMLKTVSLMSSANQNGSSDSSTLSGSESDSDSTSDTLTAEEMSGDEDDDLEGIVGGNFNISEPGTVVSSMRCAAHTLQLAVNGVLKMADYKTTIG